MAKFMYILRGGGYADPRPTISPTEIQAHLAKWTAWSNGLLAAGKLASSQGLLHPPTGKTVRGRGKAVTDGPYAESKDLVSGTLIIEAESLEEATRLAMDCPIFEFDGSVEVRPAAPT